MLRGSIMTGVLVGASLLCAAQEATTQLFVLLTPDRDLRSTVERARSIHRAGIQVSVVASAGCMVGRGDPADLDQLADGSREVKVIRTLAQIDAAKDATKASRPALDRLRMVLTGAIDDPTAPEMDWDLHSGEDALERPEPAQGNTEHGDAKNQGGSAPPDWTCTVGYNSEVMSGLVVASTFFVESDGTIDPNNYDWTAVDINSVKAQIIDAWDVWSYTASLHGHAVTAIMDWYEPAGGIPVQGYEPIDHPSTHDHYWTNAIMANLGYSSGGQFGTLDAFNHDRRTAFGADRSLSCFVACNPPGQGAPSSMTDGKIGYAYLGGPYTQILLKANGWSTTQVNRVYGHEIGHIFHAFDEYGSSGSTNCTRSFNGETNSNYQGSTCNGTQACVMINNSIVGTGATRRWNMCSHTPFHLGWQGTVPPAALQAPINDSMVTESPVTLRWARNNAPAGVIAYVKVFDRSTGQQVYCGYTGADTTRTVLLTNGPYDWAVGLGNASTSSGYAGVIGASGQFTVAAPLNADLATSTNSPCAGDAVTFTDMSTGAPVLWQWTFAGGTPGSHTGQDPPPIFYNAPGTYDVKLVINDGLLSDSLTLTNAITVTGGITIPHLQDLDGGIFPPAGWTLTGGTGQGGSTTWTGDPTGSCGQNTSALVDGYNATQNSYTTLTSPKFDLTTSDLPYLRFKVSYAQADALTFEQLNVAAHDCNYQTYSTIYTKTGAELATNGGAYHPSPQWVPASCADWRTEVRPLVPLRGEIVIFDLSVYTTGGQAVYVDDFNVFEGCRLHLKVMLQGPYETTPDLMRDDLRDLGYIPTLEPYTGLGYQFRGEGGAEISTADMLLTGPDAIVDWVLVEIRDPLAPAIVHNAKAALVQRDGDVVESDGTTALEFGVEPGPYHVAVRHRDHLGVMTATPTNLSTAGTVLDLSATSTQTWGTDARAINGSRALLWAGDVSHDGQVKYTGPNNDRDAILQAIGGSIPTNTVMGYRQSDANLDGTVKYTGSANDRDLILQVIGGTIPTQVRHEQLP